MPVLILAIASFLAVTAVLVPLIAVTLDSRAIRHKRDLALAQPPLLSISEAFDPVYSVLWQAPIAAQDIQPHPWASPSPPFPVTSRP